MSVFVFLPYLLHVKTLSVGSSLNVDYAFSRGCYLAVLPMIFSTRLESSMSMVKTSLAEATTGGGSEFENRYGLHRNS